MCQEQTDYDQPKESSHIYYKTKKQVLVRDLVCKRKEVHISEETWQLGLKSCSGKKEYNDSDE